MSYRIWWLIAFWALGIGVAIEIERPEGDARGGPQAAAQAASATVAV